MDTVTHAMFGALASRAIYNPAKTADSSACQYTPLAAATVGAAFPDIDYLLFPLDPLAFLAEWHRTWTNSILLLPLWTALLSGIIMLLLPRLRQQVLLVSSFIALGIASHILLDLLTVYGSRIFFPLSDKSFSFGTTFVIDPYLSLVIFVGLVLSFPRARHQVAITSIAIVCVYVLFQWYLKTIQEEVWNKAGFETIVLPQPYSPFHFRIINREDNHYETTLVDYLGISEKLQRREGTIPYIEQVTAFKSSDNVKWETWSLFGEKSRQQALARTVWKHDEMSLYRDFARYPILYRIDENNKDTCVWFSDLRYHIGIMTPSFRYGMCQGDDNEWKRYRLKYFSEERD